MSAPITFRWSLWGPKYRRLEQLRHSIETFRCSFGPAARYLVCTDEPNELAALLDPAVEVIDMSKGPGRRYHEVSAQQIWRKWCPSPRIAPGHTEVYVDSDVFILGEPDDLRAFCLGQPGDRILALAEYPSMQRWTGIFQLILDETCPAINAGIFGQQPGVDVTARLDHYFDWWRDQVSAWGGLLHDEQGAIAAIAAEYASAGKLDILPSSRYIIVDAEHNADIDSDADVAIVHAVSAYHPAYFWFKDRLQFRAADRK